MTPKSLQRWLILSDVHVPFHDKDLLVKVLKLIVDARPYGLILNGDFLDLFSLGSYNADSLFFLKQIDLGEEYQAGNWVLSKLDSAMRAGSHKFFVYGNHEDRYFRELQKGDTAKYGDALRSPTEALKLRERGYTVLENWKQDFVKLGEHLEVTHGTHCNVHVAKKEMEESQSSVIVGHSHRFNTHVEGKRGGFNFGFLGDLESKYFHYMPRTARNKWVNSLGFSHIDDHGDFYVEPIQCFGGRFVYNGKAY
jgi:predicted phosphodiesterase